MRVLAGVLFVAGLLAMTSLSSAQPPGGGKGGQGKGGKGFPGGKGGFAAPQPGQVMPTFIAEQLKLTDDQKKQFETLQKEVDEKLGKILTEDQMKQLKEIKDRGPRGFGGFGGGGGFGGAKGGDKGGKGGKGGNPPPPPEE